MNEKVRDIYKNLYTAIEKASDAEMLDLLSSIALSLHSFHSDELGEAENSPGSELSEWADLKAEGSDMARDYGSGIKRDFSDIFS